MKNVNIVNIYVNILCILHILYFNLVIHVYQSLLRRSNPLVMKFEDENDFQNVYNVNINVNIMFTHCFQMIIGLFL